MVKVITVTKETKGSKGMTNVVGRWTDGEGRQEIITFNNQWGEYIFNREEQIRLLEGREITFRKRGRNGMFDATGHIQFSRGRYRFVPTFDEEYQETPLFRISRQSGIILDFELEKIVHEFLDLRYYQPALNNGDITDYEVINDEERQNRGIDVIFIKNNLRYIVDEKAQARYIYDPLNTFVLELMNARSGNVGWFIDDNKETLQYLFIWPFTQETIIAADTIESLDYALVERSSLIEAVSQKTGKDTNEMLEYARRIRETDGVLDGAEEVIVGGERKGYKYRTDGFNDDIYIRYSNHINEKPINLVVRKKFLEDLSEEHGTLR